ncbi:MAG TPA: RsmE family RNA methyltransferase [Ignavibacteriaceae bacterium]|nr:RsmE family RNA methyltransferase [Ignavibacteriaceae bacterium]
MEFLSNIELYYTELIDEKKNQLIIADEEYNHLIKVMRHNAGDIFYVTDGKGKIYKCEILFVEKRLLSAGILESYTYPEKNKNIYFCLPKLKHHDRFDFALEKCVELGIINFIIFDSDRAISKGDKSERWYKIAAAAMKQSLQSYLPKIEFIKNLKLLSERGGVKILFEQNSNKSIQEFLLDVNKNYYFIFGPEGGLTEIELSYFAEENYYKLANNRLRTETAIIKAASLLSK